MIFVWSFVLFVVLTGMLYLLGVNVWLGPKAVIDRVSGESWQTHEAAHPSLVFRDVLEKLGDLVPASPKDMNLAQRRLIRAFLRMHGYETDEAGSPREAIRNFLRESHDLILLDRALGARPEFLGVLRAAMSAKGDGSRLVALPPPGSEETPGDPPEGFDAALCGPLDFGELQRFVVSRLGLPGGRPLAGITARERSDSVRGEGAVRNG